MNGLIEYQTQNNVSTRNSWASYRPHRERITRLLRDVRQAGSSRLCVLGAGNCNDLDLTALLDDYRAIHLVDLDADALACGVAHQGVQSNAAICLHGGLDLTGVLDELAQWGPGSAVPDRALAACVEEPRRRAGAALPGPFEVVISTCLLSQLVASVVRTIGERHPRFLAALLAVRAGHLRLLADLVAPGGMGVLVNDLVSSDTYPRLASVPVALWPALIGQLIRAGNFFHGANPAPIAAFLRTDPVVAGQITELEWAAPWLWDLGPRVYLVYACTFGKRSARS